MAVRRDIASPVDLLEFMGAFSFLDSVQILSRRLSVLQTAKPCSEDARSYPAKNRRILCHGSRLPARTVIAPNVELRSPVGLRATEQVPRSFLRACVSLLRASGHRSGKSHECDVPRTQRGSAASKGNF